MSLCSRRREEICFYRCDITTPQLCTKNKPVTDIQRLDLLLLFCCQWIVLTLRGHIRKIEQSSIIASQSNRLKEQDWSMTGSTFPDTIDTMTKKWWQKPIYVDIYDSKAISPSNWEVFEVEMQQSAELVILTREESSPHSSSVES